jgi:hypothetical protein
MSAPIPPNNAVSPAERGGVASSERSLCEAKLSSLENERESWIPHWRTLADYVLPRRSQYLSKKRQWNQGGQFNTKIVDSTATLAARVLTSGMMSGLTSPARPWFRLTTPDPDARDHPEVRDWLYLVESRMYETFAKSNLYTVLPVLYSELGVFGTAAVLIEGDHRNVIRCRPYTIGEYVLGHNSKREVDTLMSTAGMTSSQLIQEFGRDNVPQSVLADHDAGTGQQTWHEVVHAIEPNEDQGAGMGYGNQQMPYKSLYFIRSDYEKEYLMRSGYESFPILAPRWQVYGSDVYGSSCPAMEAIGDIKALQLEQKRKAEAIDKMVKPPMNAPASLMNQGASILPGDINYHDATAGGMTLTPTYEMRWDIGPLLQDIAENQSRISRGFHEDLFLMLTHSDRRQITAREINERHEEKLLMLGPVLERLIDDLLDPLIERTFLLMSNHYTKMIPPAPAVLEGQELKVEYISVLAQAQRAVGVQGIERLWGTASQIAQVSPGVLDKMDADQSIDELADMYGVPPTIIRSDADVEDMREQRAQAQAQAQMVAQQREQAETAKIMSETSLEGNNAATAAADARQVTGAV